MIVDPFGLDLGRTLRNALIDAENENGRLRAALITWRNAFEAGRNEVLHIAYENGNAALGVPSDQAAAESAILRATK